MKSLLKSLNFLDVITEELNYTLNNLLYKVILSIMLIFFLIISSSNIFSLYHQFLFKYENGNQIELLTYLIVFVISIYLLKKYFSDKKKESSYEKSIMTNLDLLFLRDKFIYGFIEGLNVENKNEQEVAETQLENI